MNSVVSTGKVIYLGKDYFKNKKSSIPGPREVSGMVTDIADKRRTEQLVKFTDFMRASSEKIIEDNKPMTDV